MVLTFFVGIGVLSSLPKPIIIIGTIAIFLMNIIIPVIEKIYSKFNRKEYEDKKDVKGISFIISLGIAIVIGIISYFSSKNLEWFETIMSSGFIWGSNTAILFANIAMLEIENNNLEKEKLYNERVEMKIEYMKKLELIKQYAKNEIKYKKEIEEYEKELKKYKGENDEK